MGICLFAKYQDAPSYYMGYGAFFRLRVDVAYAVSKEYGDHYKELPRACAGMNVQAYNERTKALIKKYKCRERFLDFLYQSDTGGKLSPFKCKAVLDQIKDTETEHWYGYAAYPDDCMTFEQFKDLLRECYERHQYLYWS